MDGGLVRFGKHHLKIDDSLSLPIFFHMAPPCGGHFFRMTLHFSKNKRKKNRTLPQVFNFFNILYYFSPLRCCAHHEENIYNPYSTETCSLKNPNQKKEKSISDLLVMARPRSVCDIWPIIGIFLIWIDECKNDPGGGSTAIYGPYRYVPLWKIWFSSSLL